MPDPLCVHVIDDDPEFRKALAEEIERQRPASLPRVVPRRMKDVSEEIRQLDLIARKPSRDWLAGSDKNAADKLLKGLRADVYLLDVRDDEASPQGWQGEEIGRGLHRYFPGSLFLLMSAFIDEGGKTDPDDRLLQHLTLDKIYYCRLSKKVPRDKEELPTLPEKFIAEQAWKAIDETCAETMALFDYDCVHLIPLTRLSAIAYPAPKIPDGTLRPCSREPGFFGLIQGVIQYFRAVNWNEPLSPQRPTVKRGKAKGNEKSLWSFAFARGGRPLLLKSDDTELLSELILLKMDDDTTKRDPAVGYAKTFSRSPLTWTTVSLTFATGKWPIYVPAKNRQKPRIDDLRNSEEKVGGVHRLRAGLHGLRADPSFDIHEDKRTYDGYVFEDFPHLYIHFEESPVVVKSGTGVFGWYPVDYLQKVRII